MEADGNLRAAYDDAIARIETMITRLKRPTPPSAPAPLRNGHTLESNVTAFTQAGEVMGIRHKNFPTFGVQFHPESILTQHGKQILKNFLTQGDIK